jgi:GNAT superfamily N-acetyltransferase
VDGIELITTHLEMRERPHLQVTGPHRGGMLLRLDEPSIPFYRYLYEQVGGSRPLRERAGGSDVELGEHLLDPRIDVVVFFLGGAPAGFFELDRRVENEVRLVHYGLLPEFRGRGLGRWLLAIAVDAAWVADPERVWATITSRDDPRALLTYQWAGFTAVETSREDSGD